MGSYTCGSQICIWDLSTSYINAYPYIHHEVLKPTMYSYQGSMKEHTNDQIHFSVDASIAVLHEFEVIKLIMKSWFISLRLIGAVFPCKSEYHRRSYRYVLALLLVVQYFYCRIWIIHLFILFIIVVRSADSQELQGYNYSNHHNDDHQCWGHDCRANLCRATQCC